MIPTGFIELRQKILPIVASSKYDQGYPMILRKDPELLDKVFNLNKFITNNGKCGYYANEKSYSYAGNLNFLENKIPFSLLPNSEKVTRNFIDDFIENTSIRVGKKIAPFERDKFNDILNNTNNSYDPIKREIKLSIIEVTSKYEGLGHQIKNDPRFLHSYLYNTKSYEFIGDLTKSLKLYFHKERERYENDVDPYAGSTSLRQQHAEKYFQQLTKEKLNEIFKGVDVYNWITKGRAVLPKETSSLIYKKHHLYQKDISEVPDKIPSNEITLRYLVNGNPEFRRFVKNMKNVNFDVIYIKQSTTDTKNDMQFLDFTKSFKNKDNKCTFEKVDNMQDSFLYQNKDLFKNGSCLGKFKFKTFKSDDQKKNIYVFLKKNC